MGFDTTYRFSVHAAIFNEQGQVLLLRQSYGDNRWGLPGGGVEPGETIYEAIQRECLEELGVVVSVESLTGLYYHREFNSQVCIFRCAIEDIGSIQLSKEHTEYRFTGIESLGEVQRTRVRNAMNIDATISAQVF